MTKLTWARWTGWGEREGRGESAWGTSEQGVALRRGWPSPAAKGTMDLGGKSSSSSKPLFLPGGGGRSMLPGGTAHPLGQGSLSSVGGRCQPTLSGVGAPRPVCLSSRDGRQFSLLHARPSLLLAGPAPPSGGLKGAPPRSIMGKRQTGDGEQCDPRLCKAGASLPASWPQPQSMEEASDSADGVAWVRTGSWGDGQMPSCQEERTWLLYAQVHCPLPCPKQLIFNISIPWLIFKHGSFPDKFFRGAFAVGLGGSRLSWRRTRLEQDGCPTRSGRLASVGSADSRLKLGCLEEQ